MDKEKLMEVVLVFMDSVVEKEMIVKGHKD